jgi:hypothetical protein
MSFEREYRLPSVNVNCCRVARSQSMFRTPSIVIGLKHADCGVGECNQIYSICKMQFSLIVRFGTGPRTSYCSRSHLTTFCPLRFLSTKSQQRQGDLLDEH